MKNLKLIATGIVINLSMISCAQTTKQENKKMKKNTTTEIKHQITTMVMQTST